MPNRAALLLLARTRLGNSLEKASLRRTPCIMFNNETSFVE